MNRVLLLAISFFCGYLFINWMPIPKPFQLSSFILGFVFNPVTVFAGTIVFIIGFITNGIFIRDTIHRIKKAMGNEGMKLEIIMCSLFFFSHLLLFKFGLWQSVLFFSFAFIYGMMTIEKIIKDC